MIEADADTGMRDYWINGIHHQGIAILGIIFKEHLPTLWFKQIERRFQADRATIPSWTKDAFKQIERTISSRAKARFLAEQKDDF